MWRPGGARQEFDSYIHPDAERAKRGNKEVSSRSPRSHKFRPIRLQQLRGPQVSNWRPCDCKPFDALRHIIVLMLSGNCFLGDVILSDRSTASIAMQVLVRQLNSQECTPLRRVSPASWKPIPWQDSGFLASFADAVLDRSSAGVLGESIANALRGGLTKLWRAVCQRDKAGTDNLLQRIRVFVPSEDKCVQKMASWLRACGLDGSVGRAMPSSKVSSHSPHRRPMLMVRGTSVASNEIAESFDEARGPEVPPNWRAHAALHRDGLVVCTPVRHCRRSRPAPDCFGLRPVCRVHRDEKTERSPRDLQCQISPRESIACVFHLRGRNGCGAESYKRGTHALKFCVFDWKTLGGLMKETVRRTKTKRWRRRKNKR